MKTMVEMQSSPAHSNPNSDPLSAGGCGMRDASESVLDKTKSEEDEDESSFMEKLKAADWKRYCFQKDMMRCRPPFDNREIIYFTYSREYDSRANQSFPIVKARDLDGGVKHYSFDELMQMTDSFQSTFICFTHFGTLHRGTIRTESGVQNVLVKTWEYFYPLGEYEQVHHTTRICEELNLLRDPDVKSHPNVVNLIGFHCERRLAVIYEGGFFELLHKLITNDNFSWADRMNVAVDIASMLETFHDKELVHGGVYSKNIVVNKEKCPVVYDFSLFSCCEDRMEYESLIKKVHYHYDKYLDGPPWSMRCDIFAYGTLLLELVNKQVYPKFNVPNTEDEILKYDREKSAVHESFYVDEHTALGFTQLAIKCLKVKLDEQPSIQGIVREFKDLAPYNRPNKLQKIFC